MAITNNTPLANHHISVDCVVVGFDGEQLKVLLLVHMFAFQTLSL